MKLIKFFIILINLLICFSVFSQSQEIFGNAEIGDQCSSDYQCENFCCDKTVGRCGSHNPSANPASSCNKAVGESCVTSAFCKSEYIVMCEIVKTTVLNGKQQCALRCPQVLTSGICKNFTCEAPRIPAVPPFDPNDCSNAVDP